jgi:hypothetical protein
MTLVPVVARPAAVPPWLTDGQYLAVDWREGATDGRPLVSGTVRNISGWGIVRIQLLVEGLGPDGQVLDQRVVWLGTDLPAGQRAYFETPGFARATAHRVRVFAFDSVQRL